MSLLKNQIEISKMRKTGKLVNQVIHETAKSIRPGITTAELEDVAVVLMEERGLISPCLGYAPTNHSPFPAWTCISVNEEIVHAVPGRRALKEGDLVTIDICAEYGGWVADSAWTFPVGKVSPRAEKLLKVTEESLYRGIAQARPGNKTGDISNAIQKYVENHGFSIVEELSGHGVGRTMHEGELCIPNFGARNKGTRLQSGMTFAIEPMINLGRKDILTRKDGWTIVTKDGSLSAHFEHTIAIVQGGSQILTCP